MPAPLHEPPGPIGLPLLGVIAEFRRNPPAYLLQLAREYGDVVRYRLGERQVYLINRPGLVEEVLVTNAGSFTKSFILQRARTLFGDGLLTAEGTTHVRLRKMVQPAFYRDRLAAYSLIMTAAADEAQEEWHDGQTLDIAQEMMRLTLRIVCLTLFGLDLQDEAVGEIEQSLTDLIGSFRALTSPFAPILQRFRLGAIGRSHRAHDVLHARIDQIIRQRRAQARDTGDLLSTLLGMAATDAEGQERPLTDQQVRDQALTLMLAGHETTATALSWTWYCLSQHPEIEARLREEWRAVLNGREPVFADLPALEYTERVLAETLRLYPPAWIIGRQSRGEYRLYNYLLPKGALLQLCPYVMHRDPRYWPDPEIFDPDRFTASAKSARPRFSYFPFGGGPRVCIGERFAWTEGVLLLATIGQKWRFRHEPGHRAEMNPQITLRPRYGMRMIASRMLA